MSNQASADRVLYLVGDVDDRSTSALIYQMLECDRRDPMKPIDLFINSPGGIVHSGLGIYDVMQSISAPVRTLCLGWAMSMGSLLLAAGAKGDRYALPNSYIMTHSVQSGMGGAFADLKIAYNHTLDLHNKVKEIYIKHTEKTEDVVEDLLARDTYMPVEKAKKNGLIDHILYPKREELPLTSGTQAQEATA